MTETVNRKRKGVSPTHASRKVLFKITIKLSEIEIFSEYRKTKPVLLLDDIFSELDITKRNKLLEYINTDIQSIITTTDLKNIKSKYINDSYIYEIKNGNVERR